MTICEYCQGGTKKYLPFTVVSKPLTTVLDCWYPNLKELKPERNSLALELRFVLANPSRLWRQQHRKMQTHHMALAYVYMHYRDGLLPACRSTTLPSLLGRVCST